MGKYVVENTIKKLISSGVNVRDAKVAIFGFTFKENTPDTRNTRVIDIVEELKEYGITPMIVDPVADKEEAKHEYGLTFQEMSDIENADVLILAVSHDEFSSLTQEEINAFYGDN